MIEAHIEHCIKNGKPILGNINFVAKAGGITAILGPNGAGKTTLLRILSGLETNFEGQINYNNIPLKAFKPIQLAKIRAILSQQIHVSFPCKAQDVIVLGRFAQTKDKNYLHDNHVIAWLCEQIAIKHLINRDFHTLSGGEKQRIHWARVLAQLVSLADIKPSAALQTIEKILFLDEPVTSLDIKHQVDLLKTAQNQAQNQQRIVVAILHDLNLAARYADIIYLMKNGEIVARGTPREVLTVTNIENVYEVSCEIIHTNSYLHIILNANRELVYA